MIGRPAPASYRMPTQSVAIMQMTCKWRPLVDRHVKKKEKKTQTERSDGDRQKTDGKEKHEGKQRAVN